MTWMEARRRRESRFAPLLCFLALLCCLSCPPPPAAVQTPGGMWWGSLGPILFLQALHGPSTAHQKLGDRAQGQVVRTAVYIYRTDLLGQKMYCPELNSPFPLHVPLNPPPGCPEHLPFPASKELSPSCPAPRGLQGGLSFKSLLLVPGSFRIGGRHPVYAACMEVYRDVVLV